MELSVLFALALSFSSVQVDTINPGKHLIGTWKAETNDGQFILIEFAENGDYNLIQGGEVLTCGDEDFGQIKYALEPSASKRQLGVVLYDEITQKEYCRLSADLKAKHQQLKLTLYWQNKAVDQVELSRFFNAR